MVARLLNRPFGFLPQEYLCVAIEDMDTLLAQVSFKDSAAIVDVTDKQLLLGYKPLVMAIRLDDIALNAENICLNFGTTQMQATSRWRGFQTDKSGIARIELKKSDQSLGVPAWDLFVGVYGNHRFLKGYQRLANSAKERWRRKPQSDANISGNLYDQVRIAYSTPR